MVHAVHLEAADVEELVVGLVQKPSDSLTSLAALSQIRRPVASGNLPLLTSAPVSIYMQSGLSNVLPKLLSILQDTDGIFFHLMD